MGTKVRRPRCGHDACPSRRPRDTQDAILDPLSRATAGGSHDLPDTRILAPVSVGRFLISLEAPFQVSDSDQSDQKVYSICVE